MKCLGDYRDPLYKVLLVKECILIEIGCVKEYVQRWDCSNFISAEMFTSKLIERRRIVTAIEYLLLDCDDGACASPKGVF